MKTVAIIPARSGSKRLPNKNKKEFLGCMLISWTIEQALDCDFINEIVISTNDKDILDIEKSIENYPRIRLHKRPEKYAQDDSPMTDVVIDCLNGYPLDTDIILLQPTSPLRDSTDILIAWNLYQANKPLPLITAHWKKGDYNIRLNGAIYITQLRRIFYGQGFIISANTLYLMPEEKSIDIDTIEDFERAESIMKKRLDL
jgi:CMP-N-acetylneuraminic acid synthetase